jgi:hypothetical protein
MKQSLIGISVVLACLASSAWATGPKDRYVIRATDSLRTILESDVGLPVKLRLRSGNEISGTITRIGNGIVQISEVSGMEFYDAIVSIDDISAVLIKARKK